MTIETDFRALLVASAGITALVPANDIALGAVEAHPQDAATAPTNWPYIVINIKREPLATLADPVPAEDVTATVQCWARNSTLANQIADAVVAALHGSSDYCLDERNPEFDPVTEMDAVTLVFSDTVVAPA